MVIKTSAYVEREQGEEKPRSDGGATATYGRLDERYQA
jgi:hypothetical protein